MHSLLVSCIPLLLIVAITLITKELRIALCGSIISAGILIHKNNITAIFKDIALKTYTFFFSQETLFLYIFLICIPILITLFIETKTAHSFASRFTHQFLSKKKLSYTTCLASIFLSIDDYLSILTVGNVFRPLFDTIGLSRAKLAYFIHALSGPIVILLPLSSWVATITSYLAQAGVEKTITTTTLIIMDPFNLYLYTIPFILYSLLTCITIFYIITYNISYGPMQTAEKLALPTIVFSDQETMNQNKETGLELLYSFLFLLSTTFAGMLYQGNAWILGGNNSIIKAILNISSIFSVLCFSSLITLIATLFYFIMKKKIKPTIIPSLIWKGYCLMAPVLQMIFLTSILSSFLKNDLGIGFLFAKYLNTTTTPTYIPVGFFIIALLVSLATGSSWTTFGILLSVAIPIISKLNLQSLLGPTLGAIFSGALCGDHISPFSETTLMSAHAAQINPQEHTKTQILYTVPVISGCIIGFLSFGFFHSTHMSIQYLISMGTSIISCIGTVCLLKKIY